MKFCGDSGDCDGDSQALWCYSMKLGGGGEPCTLCQKTVYPAEKQKTANGCYHVKCFSCTKCKRQLQQSTFVEDAATGRLYCRPHYAQLAKEAGLSKLATGGVDESAGVLVVKKTKQEVAEEVDTLVVGSAVWVELGVDKASEKLVERAKDEPFVRATVTRVGEDFIGVRTTSGATADMPHHLVLLAEPASGKVNNLQLLHLNEPNLLDNVRERFNARQIYTYTGQLELLVMNPYEDIAGLYSQARMEQHRDAYGKEGVEVEPHTFAVAERVWRAIEEAGKGGGALRTAPPMTYSASQ